MVDNVISHLNHPTSPHLSQNISTQSNDIDDVSDSHPHTNMQSTYHHIIRIPPLRTHIMTTFELPCQRNIPSKPPDITPISLSNFRKKSNHSHRTLKAHPPTFRPATNHHISQIPSPLTRNMTILNVIFNSYRPSEQRNFTPDSLIFFEENPTTPTKIRIHSQTQSRQKQIINSSTHLHHRPTQY